MKKQIKRSGLIIIMFMLTTIIGGCSFSWFNPPITVNSTKDFELVNYVAEGAIFQQKSNCLVKGTAEEGVQIYLTIYDSSNRVYKKYNVITSEDGTFAISFRSPKGSLEPYSFYITDNKYVHDIKNIYFGEVWMIVGERYGVWNNNTELSEQVVHVFSDGKWTDKESSTDFINQFAVELASYAQMPVGIVDSTATKANFDAWLSPEKINLHPRLSDFLQETGRYLENPLLEQDYSNTDQTSMSSLYLEDLVNLKDFGISCLLLNIGYSDFNDVNKAITSYVYKVQMGLQTLVDFLVNEFSPTKLYMLQAGQIEKQNELYGMKLTESMANDLRSSQAVATFNNAKASVVATYDLERSYDGDDVEYQPLTIELLNERLMDIISNEIFHGKVSYQCPAYTNFIFTGNTLAIEFKNCSSLLPIEKEIYALTIRDNLGEMIPYEFEIVGNWLYINLLPTETNDLHQIQVEYCFGNDMYLGNLTTNRNLPILPFSFLLRG